MTTDAGNPFEALGIAPRFDLDQAQLRSAWLARSAALHPDRAAGDNAERQHALARVNQAMRTLSDPLHRAEALLELLRRAPEPPELAKRLPEGFLQQMLEVREEAEGAAGEDLLRWEKWGDERRAEYQARVADLFRHAQATPGKSEILDAIRVELNAWRYIHRMLQQIGEG